MLYNVYCDETCHLEHDGINDMVIGAVWCPQEKLREINQRIREIKIRNGISPTAELKWTKISPAMAAFCFSACKVTYHYEKRRVFAKQCGSFFREMVYYFFINILSCLCAVRADLIGRAQYGIPHGT